MSSYWKKHRLAQGESMRVAVFHLLLSPLFLAPCYALEARWTPASDGGPARFSKRYRDAAGIDDSRWIEKEQDSHMWLPRILPESPQGAAFALAYCLYTILYPMFSLLGPTAFVRPRLPRLDFCTASGSMHLRPVPAATAHGAARTLCRTEWYQR
jgi:hypothetical protein